MLEKIKDIEKAIICECYLAALALALTVPDICGEIEFPHIVREKGDRDVGGQYRAWFNKWVEPHYADDTGWNKGCGAFADKQVNIIDIQKEAERIEALGSFPG